MPLTAVSGALGVWAVVVAGVDVRHRRIPNALLLTLLVPALLAFLVTGRGLLGVAPLASALGLLASAVPLLPGYALGYIGAGDVKFSALIGLLVGPLAALQVLAGGLIVLGLASAAVMLGRRYAAQAPRRIPAAPAFSVAFLFYLLLGA